jgi:hypothetical protein
MKKTSNIPETEISIFHPCLELELDLSFWVTAQPECLAALHPGQSLLLTTTYSALHHCEWQAEDGVE